MDVSLIISAFIAGVFTFLAPCTLPLVPGYLGFISGGRKVFLNGFFFVLGWSAVFILLGTLIGFVGAAFLAPYRWWLGRIGGVFVIIFGLYMLKVAKIPFLQRELKFHPPVFFERGKLLNSFILGSAFAFGWTPCVGPILGSILLLTSTSATALQGAFLLAVFSAGLAMPFLAIALAIGSAARFIKRISGYLDIVSVVGGIFLVFLGVLLISGNMAFLISWGYYLFRFINYDRLLDYL